MILGPQRQNILSFSQIQPYKLELIYCPACPTWFSGRAARAHDEFQFVWMDLAETRDIFSMGFMIQQKSTHLFAEYFKYTVSKITTYLTLFQNSANMVLLFSLLSVSHSEQNFSFVQQKELLYWNNEESWCAVFFSWVKSTFQVQNVIFLHECKRKTRDLARVFLHRLEKL